VVFISLSFRLVVGFGKKPLKSDFFKRPRTVDFVVKWVFSTTAAIDMVQVASSLVLMGVDQD
jgi:hypothetical protein